MGIQMKKQRKVKVAVLVSGGGTNLQAIIDAVAAKVIKNAEISLVISNNASAYALTRAENAGIKTAIITKKESDGSQELFEDRLIERLKNDEIELIVLAGFMSILSERFTKTFERRIINVHPSLIPSFCGKGFYGLHVHEAALAYGVKVTGATVHFVNEIPDGGEIILQKSVSVKKGETPESLQQRVMRQAEWIILPRAVELVSKEIIANRKVSK
ncbi:MAG: phosphoribosylglycinamide formyltransferase [Ruminococcaceae bacterium]|nr:phosphoribosylglycinamide formyltransferase [Oscillospiraceae bacterium]